MTVYPSAKDTSSSFLVINGVTPIDSTLFAKFSSAILAIESELGINPSGTFSDIRQRLDVIDGYASTGGYLPVATLKQHLEHDGTSWVAVDDFTFPENPDDTRTITITSPTTTPTSLTIKTPDAPIDSSFSSGTIQIYTGAGGASASALNSGDIQIYSGQSNNAEGRAGGVELWGGDQAASYGQSGYVRLCGGSGLGLNATGGNIHLTPGAANTLSNIGKIFIDVSNTLYGQPTFTNQYYPIYARTSNVDGYYPGIRYNNVNKSWEIKSDGYDESSWEAIVSGTVDALPTATQYQHLEHNGSQWSVVDDLTLPGNLIEPYGSRKICVDKRNLSIVSGDADGADDSTGYIWIYSENGPIATGSDNGISSGDLFIQSGNGGNSDSGNAGASARVYLYSGDGGASSSGVAGDSGDVYVYTGNSGISTSGQCGNSGKIEITTGTCYQSSSQELAGHSGQIRFTTGDAGFVSPGSGGGKAGFFIIEPGETRKDNNTEDETGYITLNAGNAYSVDGYAGYVSLFGGRAYNSSSHGGNVKLIPGQAEIESKVGKILIHSSSYYNGAETATYTNKYSIYAKTNDLYENYPGIRYEGSLNKWQYKIDGESESSWHDLISSSSSSASSSVIDILWGTSVADGYLVYTDAYSSSPELKVANLAIANNYSYSNVIGAGYSETNKVIINGVHSVYCDTAASPGDILYLSSTNQGMASTTIPTASNSCITIIGKCFTEKSAGIGTCDVLLNIREPILLE